MEIVQEKILTDSERFRMYVWKRKNQKSSAGYGRGKIFVQSEERCDDGCKSLADRTKTNDEMQKALKAKDNEAYAKSCM